MVQPTARAQRLVVTESVKEVLLRPAFLAAACSTNLAVLAISFFMEKSLAESSKQPTVLVHRNTYINILSYTALIAVTIFTKSAGITQGIVHGKSPAVRRARLRALPWPFGVVCGGEGERSLLTFVTYSLLFPGVFVLCLLILVSYAVNGGAQMLHWAMPLKQYLLWTMVWRGAIYCVVFFMNYLAAHNNTQPQLQPDTQED